MTIKEIEEKSGLTRANIRFYESEGLFEVGRNANGYRDYTEENLQQINKIKLLRYLDVPVEEIKKLISKESVLSAVLEQQLKNLEDKAVDIDISKDVCKEIKNDGVSYESLQPQRYLDLICEKKQNSNTQNSTFTSKLKADSEVHEVSPFRRFFARMGDLWLYNIIFSTFLVAVCKVNVSLSQTQSMWDFLGVLFSLIVMLFLEPLLISKFGTTLFKHIFGISVYNENGNKMTYSEAWIRTFSAMWYGFGFNIPIYSIIRLYKSHSKYANGEYNEWQTNEIMKIKPGRFRQVVGFVLIVGVLFGGFMLCSYKNLTVPQNRGDITITEFAENFNSFQNYMGEDDDYELNSNGEVVEKTRNNYIDLFPCDKSFEYITDENGYVQEVIYKAEVNGSSLVYKDTGINETVAIMHAFIGAQKSARFDLTYMSDYAKFITQNKNKGFQMTIHGVEITGKITHEGFDEESDDYLLNIDMEKGKEQFMAEYRFVKQR